MARAHVEYKVRGRFGRDRLVALPIEYAEMNAAIGNIATASDIKSAEKLEIAAKELSETFNIDEHGGEI
jgi:hypothetical protein